MKLFREDDVDSYVCFLIYTGVYMHGQRTVADQRKQCGLATLSVCRMPRVLPEPPPADCQPLSFSTLVFRHVTNIPVFVTRPFTGTPDQVSHPARPERMLARSVTLAEESVASPSSSGAVDPRSLSRFQLRT